MDNSNYENRRISAILATSIMLAAFGAVMVYSASAYNCSIMAKYNNDPTYFLVRQLIYFGVGMFFAVAAMLFPYRWYSNKLAYVIFLIGLGTIMLLKTPMAVNVKGATRWVNLGPIQFQPAEVVKISVIVMNAYILAKFTPRFKKYVVVLLAWIVTAVCAVLIKKISNDLSSAIVVGCIGVGMTFIFTKTYKLHLAIGAGASAVAVACIANLANNLPTPEEIEKLSFRKARLAAWIAPERYAEGKGFQTLQSMYAIGSGGVFGKGLGNSVQKLTTLPEAQNDMIFAIICEELGIVGAVMVMILYGYLLFCILNVAKKSSSMFGAALAMGVFCHIFVQTVINIGVSTGLLPNTGLALPFISYGGTALVCQLVEIGMVLSVALYTGKKDTIKLRKKRIVRRSVNA